ncbi:MAG: hypothetical protein AAF787_02235, partial [Chloroflexota bacterium]
MYMKPVQTAVQKEAWVRQQLDEIVHGEDTSVDQKVEAILCLGLEIFGMKIGIVSRVRGDEYQVMYRQFPDVGIEPGT